MGTWGTGNFDSDTAADWLSIEVERLVGDIATAIAGAPSEIEPDSFAGVSVPCALELLCLIGKQSWVGGELPAAATVKDWKKTFLRVWDGVKGETAPSAARRAVVAKTFDRVAALAARTKPPARRKARKARATGR